MTRAMHEMNRGESLEEGRQYEKNQIRICVDTIGVDLTGRAYVPFHEKVIEFTEILDLAVQLDKIFDTYGYPQAFQQKRSFTEEVDTNIYKGIPEMKWDGNTLRAQRGKIATLELYVRSRQDTSWQGWISVPHSSQSRKFQGDIAFVRTMMSLVQDIRKE